MSERVLHIGKYFPPHRGGMEVFLRGLMAEQARQGLCVSALVHSSEACVRTREEVVTWRDQQLPVVRCARWFTLAFAPISPNFPLALRRAITRHRPQLLHIHMPNPSAFWCLLLPSARKLPWVVHWHSDVLASQHKLSLRLLYWLYRFPEQWLLRRAKCVFATSPPYLETSEPLASHLEKCRVIPLGIEPRHDGSETIGDAGGVDSRLAGANNPAPLKVLAVGRLTYYKGFCYLLDALAAAPAARLTLVGDGEERDRLIRQAHDLGLDERLRFVTDCDDDALGELYQEHDVLCLPSIERTEAFGMVLLEAMRSGLPCIVTDVKGSGMRWVVETSGAGWVVPAGGSAALARVLGQLAGDRSELARLRRGLTERFRGLFQISAVSRALSECYEGMLIARIRRAP